MAVSIALEIDESNGNPTEVVTHAPADPMIFGTVDASGLSEMDPGAGQPVNSASMQKALRVHVVEIEGFAGIGSFRVYSEPPVAGWSYRCNLHTVQATYAAAAITTFQPPATSLTAVPNALPTSDPGVPNLGVGGVLLGLLSAPGWSDYCYLSLLSGTAIEGFPDGAPIAFAYELIG